MPPKVAGSSSQYIPEQSTSPIAEEARQVELLMKLRAGKNQDNTSPATSPTSSIKRLFGGKIKDTFQIAAVPLSMAANSTQGSKLADAWGKVRAAQTDQDVFISGAKDELEKAQNTFDKVLERERKTNPGIGVDKAKAGFEAKRGDLRVVREAEKKASKVLKTTKDVADKSVPPALNAQVTTCEEQLANAKEARRIAQEKLAKVKELRNKGKIEPHLKKELRAAQARETKLVRIKTKAVAKAAQFPTPTNINRAQYLEAEYLQAVTERTNAATRLTTLQQGTARDIQTFLNNELKSAVALEGTASTNLTTAKDTVTNSISQPKRKAIARLEDLRERASERVVHAESEFTCAEGQYKRLNGPHKAVKLATGKLRTVEGGVQRALTTARTATATELAEILPGWRGSWVRFAQKRSDLFAKVAESCNRYFSFGSWGEFITEKIPAVKFLCKAAAPLAFAFAGYEIGTNCWGAYHAKEEEKSSAWLRAGLKTLSTIGLAALGFAMSGIGGFFVLGFLGNFIHGKIEKFTTDDLATVHNALSGKS